MGLWHGEAKGGPACATTHCRAGHIVHAAGAAGYELERRTSTLFAAMQILHKSSPIHVAPPRFFESNEQALADMRRCAEEEQALVAPDRGN